MNAQQIFDLAREYGAEHPGITFDLAALLRYTRKVQELEREACAGLAERRLLDDDNADRRIGHHHACKSIADAIRARGQQ